ncbi:16S rRNA (guanine(527)-N(7))-methyltransferase RsmG [Pilimelia columellifera]|uniref:Ribosomal RNA small subunit methyltransferase G n=1 Tax=Pilimelia columellifera subsp. columellifera TaxID=706583 RepID=A0ABN3MZY1_9ACTN
MSDLRAESPGAPPADLLAVAEQLFGDRLRLAARYAELLVTDGVLRGLIGPREAPRVWDRHILNCAVMVDLLPDGAYVADVGSGAGLPGIVLAVARPDLHLTLVEPLGRRAAFLSEAVSTLGLDARVRVLRGRAEECVSGALSDSFAPADIVTARAVAPLDRLVGWCLPLARVGGRLLALKGASAAGEIAEHALAVTRLGGGPPTIQRCGVGLVASPTTVVVVARERLVAPARSGGRDGRRGRRR